MQRLSSRCSRDLLAQTPAWSPNGAAWPPRAAGILAQSPPWLPCSRLAGDRFIPTMRSVPPRLSVMEDTPTQAAWPSPCRKSSATGNIPPMVLEAIATTVLSWLKVSKFTAPCLPILLMQTTITSSCRTLFPPAVLQPRSTPCPI